MNNKRMKIAIVINIIIVIMTVVATIIMFTGFKFMGNDIVLECTKFEMLKFFTVQSNLFAGIMALIFAIKEIYILKGTGKGISTFSYCLKLMASVAVGVTFVTVMAYLGPVSSGGIPSMLKNSNLFFHCLIPVASMINFAFFEKTDKLKFRYTFCGFIPTLLYGTFYLTNALIHMENGKVSPVYDWYLFGQRGIFQLCMVVLFMWAATYVLGLVLWRINKIK